MPDGAFPSPLFAPLAPWLQAVPRPDLAQLNQQAARRGLTSGGGQPLRFAPADGAHRGYESRLYLEGIAETRADNWHDYFGALVWLAFPQAKAAINRRHFSALEEGGGAPRGALRDALTQFDECGLIVLCADPSVALHS